MNLTTSLVTLSTVRFGVRRIENLPEAVQCRSGKVAYPSQNKGSQSSILSQLRESSSPNSKSAQARTYRRRLQFHGATNLDCLRPILSHAISGGPELTHTAHELRDDQSDFPPDRFETHSCHCVIGECHIAASSVMHVLRLCGHSLTTETNVGSVLPSSGNE